MTTASSEEVSTTVTMSEMWSKVEELLKKPDPETEPYK
jgi:hypothetical protein